MAALADSHVTGAAQIGALQEAARARNIDLLVNQVGKGDEIAPAIEAMKAAGASALNVLASPMLHTNHPLILDRVAALRLPAMFQWPEIAEEGGLFAYGP